MAVKNKEYQPVTIYEDTLMTPERKKPHKVCNTWPAEFAIPHPTGPHYTIPAKPEDKRYAFLEVGPKPSTMDLGECRTLSLLNIPAKTLALDLIELSPAGRDPITGKMMAPARVTSQFFERGLFVPEGDEPTDEELTAAETRRKRYMLEQIRRGDAAYARDHGSPVNVPGDARIAAEFLKIERPWAGSMETVVSAAAMPCPIISTHTVNRGDKKCIVCNEWIGWDEKGQPFAANDPDRKRAMAAAVARPEQRIGA